MPPGSYYNEYKQGVASSSYSIERSNYTIYIRRMKNTKLFMFAACTLFLAACGKQTVKIMTPPDASNRVQFSAEQLQTLPWIKPVIR